MKPYQTKLYKPVPNITRSRSKHLLVFGGQTRKYLPLIYIEFLKLINGEFNLFGTFVYLILR